VGVGHGVPLMVITCPGRMRLGFVSCGFSAMSVAKLTPNFRAMMLSVSPGATVYVLGDGVTVGCGVGVGVGTGLAVGEAAGEVAGDGLEEVGVGELMLAVGEGEGAAWFGVKNDIEISTPITRRPARMAKIVIDREAPEFIWSA
jgi:hypothetical protein